MSTYLITHLRIPGGIPNEQGLSYLEQVEDTLAPFGGAYLAQGAPAAIKEGAWEGSVVLIEFPDREAAEGWYASEAYQRILPLRTGSSIADTVIVDQLPEDFTVKGFVASIRAKIAASA
ncbi:DUF1330 domain-containing protein [Streptomyces sp. P6-2-1]|uniref:DUF1330 domain-containing protein n=1 Tax=Streptomyces sp. P6-2-1 TaxID=3422591 RepID=UPI003D36707B